MRTSYLEDALRYLGYQGQPCDPKTMEQIIDCIKEIEALSTPRYVYKRIQKTELKVASESLINHLKSSQEVYLYGATLGIAIDRQIKKYVISSIQKATIFNACASAYIEDLCETMREEIKDTIHQQGQSLLPSYSPGYGDLGLEYQKYMIKELQLDKKIGITITQGLMLLPTKSITGIIGITQEKTVEKKNKCMDCQKREICAFSKKGEWLCNN